MKIKKHEILSLPEFDSRILEVVLALISALEFREPFTAGHSQNVTVYSMKLGKRMHLSPEKLHDLRYAALLHDIGKIGINESILKKTGKLTKKEYDEVKKHPAIAKTILNPIAGLKNVIPIILHHHEQWDGKGYPEGLKGNKIPIESRIINVVNAYDNLVSDRVYRKKMTHKNAVQLLRSNKNKKFEGRVVDFFIELLEEIRDASKRR
ncbi:MAG: HD domain-containing protein [Spirochaetes bacterium]|nr:HD domain-containing protein [Spirochaetota bacterium]